MFHVRNIKISVKIKPLVLNNVVNLLASKGISFKIYSNFVTFKNRHFTYVLFKKGKRKNCHINITQIQTLQLIKKALESIEDLLTCKVISYKVDNIIATSDVSRKISLSEIIKKNSFDVIKYNNEVFPGLFIKFKEGTVILFHSGKIVIVGCKTLESIECILKNVLVSI